MKKNKESKKTVKLKNLKIKLFILDVDGVLTDGKLYFSDNGIETKSFNIKDGVGLKLLLKRGIEIAVISGRKSKATQKRMRELGIKYIYLGINDKIKVFDQLKKKLHLKNENISAIGDDLPDMSLMQQVGFSIAVKDAVPKIRALADCITKATGGNGAVREACELLMSPFAN
jgi:3-deoxy-D-manno-octulosonate 8-phosphate phosphatase (KDO 8-P phosphatase)